MQNAYLVNQIDTLPINFMNKPLINTLSDRDLNEKHVYGITTEDSLV